MNKINLLIILFVALGLTTVFLISILIHQNESPIRIGYVIDSINHAPVIVASEAGFFEKYGINVEMVPTGSGKETQQAIGAGQIELASSGATNIFIPISKGAPIKIIAPSTVSMMYVFVNPDKNIKTLKELVGKNVATRKGHITNVVFNEALKKGGIDGKNINFIEVDRVLAPIALMNKGIVDAALASVSEAKGFEDSGAVVLEEWKLKDYTGIPTPSTVIAVNTDFMTRYPEKIDAFMKAFIDGQKFIKEKPNEAARLISENIYKMSNGSAGISVSEVLNEWKSIKYILWCDQNLLKDYSLAAFEIGDIEKELSINQLFDPRFEGVLKNAQCEIYNQC